VHGLRALVDGDCSHGAVSGWLVGLAPLDLKKKSHLRVCETRKVARAKNSVVSIPQKRRFCND
jgi:hypothetical protein